MRRHKHRLNDQITHPMVRVVTDDENGQKSSEIMSINDALALAESKDVDLVEITPTATPPVCRLIQYGKFLYIQKKKEKENAKKSHNQEVKELRLTPHTDKVKATVFFKGREIVYKDQGIVLLLKLADTLKDIAKAESLPVLLGKKMTITLAPKN